MDENGTKFIPKLSKALPSSTKSTSTSIFFSTSLGHHVAGYTISCPITGYTILKL